MIEMHLGEEPNGDDEDYQSYPGRLSELWRLAFSAPSLAIASLFIGLASLTVIQSAEEIGETAVLGSSSQNPNDLTQLRVSAGVRLVIAAVALVMAIAAGRRSLSADADDADGEPPNPSWLGAVAGAGFVVSLVAVIVSGVSLGYALQAHLGPLGGG
jgi:hypothetical protein